MSEVVRIVCPHGLVATFIRDAGIWTTVITNVQTVRDSETGEFIEYRYPVRCEACGKRGHNTTAPANQGTLNERLDLFDELLDPGDTKAVVELPLKSLAAALGENWPVYLEMRDRMRHAATRPTSDG